MGGEDRSKACPEFECALEEYLEGELETTLAGRLTEHLEKCDACQEAFQLAAVSSALLRARREPSAEGDPWFVRRTMLAIVAEEDRLAEVRSFWSPMKALAWRIAMSAGLAVIVLLAYGRVAHLGTPSEVVARSVQARDIFQDPMRPSNQDEVLMMVTETNHDK